MKIYYIHWTKLSRNIPINRIVRTCISQNVCSSKKYARCKFWTRSPYLQQMSHGNSVWLISTATMIRSSILLVVDVIFCYNFQCINDLNCGWSAERIKSSYVKCATNEWRKIESDDDRLSHDGSLLYSHSEDLINIVYDLMFCDTYTTHNKCKNNTTNANNATVWNLINFYVNSNVGENLIRKKLEMNWVQRRNLLMRCLHNE